MSRPKALPNMPEAMTEFVTLLASLVKDPSLLAPMVKAAEDIAAANAMTEQEAAALKEAQDVVTQATLAGNRLTAERAEIEGTKKALQRALDDIAGRERALDGRTTDLAKAEKALGEKRNDLSSSSMAINARDGAVTRRENSVQKREAAVAGRETAVAKKENALRKAAGMVSDGNDG